MSHTPGPWYYCENFNSNGAEVWSIKSESETHLGVVAALSRIPYSDLKYGATIEQLQQQEANAKLIAAAPDLLKALQFYANPDNWWRDYSQNYLAGAEGGEPSIAETDGGELAREAIRTALGDDKAV